MSCCRGLTYKPETILKDAHRKKDFNLAALQPFSVFPATILIATLMSCITLPLRSTKPLLAMRSLGLELLLKLGLRALKLTI